MTYLRAVDSKAYELAEPRPAAMIESLRAFGYTPETALADLIDNSISAAARRIWLTFHWSGPRSWVAVADDGVGMTERTLHDAMRPGSRSPLEPRDPRDLGRFGLGLKTASFSQCRRLSVVSRSAGSTVAARCWDLDYVGDSGEWRLLTHGDELAATVWSARDVGTSGTLVLWQALDRIVGSADVGDQKAQARFLALVDRVHRHLAMTFHRYLTGPRRIQIFINNDEVPIEGWDPFLADHLATQALPEEVLRLHGATVRVRPYVVPHHSKLSAAEHAAAAGPRGWNAQQGFYVYRNNRLLVAGEWLNLGFRKEEHCKLARIQLDLPNVMDGDWQIDVRKSVARPPASLAQDLRRIAILTRTRASEVYRHRGRVLARRVAQDFVFVWQRLVRHGKVSYRISQEHPVVQRALAIPEPHRTTVRALLRLVEETVPAPQIGIDQMSGEEDQTGPFEHSPSRELRQVLTEAFQALCSRGMSSSEAIQRLLVTEPFSNHPELVTSLGTPGCD